jgi:MSHA biogenesis protein MshO
MAAEMTSGFRRRRHGFTLVEAVVVIVVMGILASMLSVFIRVPVEGYFDTVRRAEMTDVVDTALRRISRDVRTALPNTLRPPANADDKCFEFLPTLGGGRYRDAALKLTGGNVLGFDKVYSNFDVLASVNLGTALTAGNRVAIYNLGISGADAYAGDTTGVIATASTTANIALSPSKQFPFESPGKRFQVIPGTSTVYACTGVGTSNGAGTGQLQRYTRTINAGNVADCTVPGSAVILAQNVSACSFTYTSAATTRAGLLTIWLGVQQGAETVQIYQEVHVDNVP